ncbi:MAG: hypothetical protein JJU29_20120 [Verrucomicrobia bacterium]|nr:hypothetical protein [Verrucomicrobiota bacterium]MCH8512501.1 hypothetical protein [Kiritimatiellia bacterium]
MTKFLWMFFSLTLFATQTLRAEPPKIYPESSGGFFGVDYTRTEHVFDFPGLQQTDELDFIGIKLGLVQNQSLYFKISGGAGYATRSNTSLQGPLALSDNPDNERGFNVNGGARIGYNFNLGPAFRIRPVIGYKIDHTRFSLRSDAPGVRTDTDVDLDYTWHGYTYGLEADLHLGNVVLFAGVDFFEASPNVNMSGNALAGNTSHSQGWDGDGTEFHVGILARIDEGIIFLRGFHQSWSASGNGNASWDVTNTGIMFGGGFGF